jgi:hypothetical protein
MYTLTLIFAHMLVSYSRRHGQDYVVGGSAAAVPAAAAAAALRLPPSTASKDLMLVPGSGSLSARAGSRDMCGAPFNSSGSPCPALCWHCVHFVAAPAVPPPLLLRPPLLRRSAGAATTALVVGSLPACALNLASLSSGSCHGVIQAASP